jgi:hypothetical protein
MEENQLLELAISRLKELKVAGKKQVVSVSISELKRYEPPIFQADLTAFLNFSMGQYYNPLLRLKSWCNANGFKTTEQANEVFIQLK